MGADRAPSAGAKAPRQTALCAASRSCRSAALSVAHGLTVASAAARFSKPLDGAALLLRLAGGGGVANHQRLAAAAGARTGGTRSQSVGRRDRQPVGQDDRKRRPARV